MDDITKKPLRRLNPYRGLILDVNTWSAAHDYHREQQRLHVLAMHSPGVVAGLDVVAWNPPDSSVVIYPGVALDLEGHTIMWESHNAFTYRLKNEAPPTWYYDIGK